MHKLKAGSFDLTLCTKRKYRRARTTSPGSSRAEPIGLVLAYTFFAAIATLVNLGTQDVTIRLYSGTHAVLLSVLMGTVVGLMVKYVLDKRYIFCFTPTSPAHDGRIFILYTLMGGLTTLVFWGVEFSFDQFFHDKWLRYFGGGVGLAVGYVTKYQLDKRFVFRRCS